MASLPLKITKCPRCGSRDLWIVDARDYLCKAGCGKMDYMEVQNLTRECIMRVNRRRRQG